MKSIILQRHAPALLRTGIVAFAIKLWLVSDTRIISTFGPIDASNYVEHAKSIATGTWFGPYNQFTLIKVPMLALTLAAMREFGIPTLLGFSIGFTLACYAACIAIRPIVRDERGLAVIFIGMYFNPMSFGTQEWMMQRGILTSIFATFVAACCIGILIRAARSRSGLVPWFCGLGCSTTALFLTREEAIWIAPLVITLIGAFAWRAYKKARGTFVARIALVMIPIGIAVASYATILGLNETYYCKRRSSSRHIIHLRGSSHPELYETYLRRAPRSNLHIAQVQQQGSYELGWRDRSAAAGRKRPVNL